MKAIVKPHAAPGLTLQDCPVPSPKHGEVLLKVRKASVCGTDLNIYNWNEWAQKNLTPPVIVGHEFMGEIVELGEGVSGWSVGDRVSAEGHITCGSCRACRTGLPHLCPNTKILGIHRDGGFAEFAAVPSSNLFRLKPFIPDDIASMLDPLGNATHTALSFDLVGEDVLITGAGPIGVMATAIARFVGARNVVISDPNEKRLALAKEMGATYTVNIAKQDLQEAVDTLGIKGYTIGMEMSGNPQALSSMLQYMVPGGKIGLLGILPSHAGIDWVQVVFKGLTLKGIFGRKIFDTWYKMTRMLEGGLNVSPVITHSIPMVDFEQGFQLMKEGSCGKVILDMSH